MANQLHVLTFFWTTEQLADGKISTVVKDATGEAASLLSSPSSFAFWFSAFSMLIDLKFEK